MRSRSIFLALLLAAMLSGCVDESAPAPDEDKDPLLVTRPDDFSAIANASRGDRAHIHDYWQGRDTLVIIDETVDDGMTWGGPPRAMHEFRPDDNVVVPQGTRSLNITVTWTSDAKSRHGTPELWVKTAARHAAEPVQELVQGETVEIVVSQNDSDLPHQILSAWTFDFVLKMPADGFPLHYSGTVTMAVTAHRGLPLPVFPAHPDAWENRTEIQLFQEDEDVSGAYQGEGGNGNCYLSCIPIFQPEDGVIVPFDAAYVEVTVSYPATTAQRLGLTFHAADSWDWVTLSPTASDPASRTYRIDLVPGMGDGVYAEQSHWRFRTVQEHHPDMFFRGSFTIEATAYRQA